MNPEGLRQLLVRLCVAGSIALISISASADTHVVLRADCEMSRDLALRVYFKGAADSSREDAALVYLCAAGIMRGDGEFGPDAELDLIDRAIRSAKVHGQATRVADSLIARAEFYARQGSVSLFLDDWDEIADLSRTPQGGGRVLQLSPELARFARVAYESGDLDSAIEIVARLERWLGGNYDVGFDEPEWLPELYTDAGNVKHAEEIHRSRIANAQLSGSNLRTAKRLDHYAKFLDSQGRSSEAAAARQEADLERQIANRDLAAEGSQEQ